MQLPARFAIRCGRLYDGTGAPPQTNVTVVVAGDRIERIAANDERLDAGHVLEAAAVTPGLINAHVHLEFSGEPDIGVTVLTTPIAKTLLAAANARRSLEAGVTTVRDLGAAQSNAIELRDAIAKGVHAGPRIVPAGRALCMTGGHGHFIGGRETDGPWDARKAVREQLKAGAECIKLIATGGVLTKGAVPGQDQLTQEEMHAAIVEAHTHGMRVAAHAIGTNGIKNALRAGVDSIEHGHLVDDEGIALLLDRKAYLVPTLAAIRCILDGGEDAGIPDYVLRKAREIAEHAESNLRRARAAGVRFAGGSDAGTPFNYHDGYALELELMQTMLGMSAREALHATTVAGADLLGLQRGTLGPGDTADLVLLAGNIDDDLRAFRDPVAVVKDGALAFERR